MTDGWEKVTVEIMLLLHLITAFPIITNPPSQLFEELLGLPTSKLDFIKLSKVLIHLFVYNCIFVLVLLKVCDERF